MSIQNNNSDRNDNTLHTSELKKHLQHLKESVIHHLNNLREDYTLSEDDFIEIKEVAKIELKDLTAQIEEIKRELKDSLEKRASK
ncbi:hypothetical protein [Acinetobacter nectaris]|uniref:hypothetical protein n=1 Tax=Acinetobacter nectaris TaxID=1219382 RepID=UPI001F262579|nr:hypothetical protein [Acinetobacter nectaris]MCF9033945.1 hypothetical protein [Acinetobacter nectaris]